MADSLYISEDNTHRQGGLRCTRTRFEENTEEVERLQVLRGRNPRE